MWLDSRRDTNVSKMICSYCFTSLMKWKISKPSCRASFTHMFSLSKTTELLNSYVDAHRSKYCQKKKIKIMEI